MILSQRARVVRSLLAEAGPVWEAAFAAGLGRDAVLPFETCGANAVRPEAAAFAAALYKRGCRGASPAGGVALLPPAVPFSMGAGEGDDLCAPCDVLTEERALAWIASLGITACVVIDDTFLALHPAWARACAPSNPFVLRVAESNKTPATVAALLAHLEEHGASATHMVTIGGGLTSDVGGFAAGLLGVPFDVVPTTYLAAVDAGQGGKTGVNTPPYGKNQLGLFHGARRFRLVPETFSTLPEEERASGACEALKHCYLSGRWPLCDDGVDLARATLPVPFLLWNMEAKASVVRADPRERGLRKLLNLGHTLGHAWEGLYEEGLVTRLPHGVAVALGMLALARAGLLAGAPVDFLAALEAVVTRFAPRRVGRQEDVAGALERLLRADKKNTSGGNVALVTPTWGLLGGFLGGGPQPEASYVTSLSPGACAAALEPWLLG